MIRTDQHFRGSWQKYNWVRYFGPAILLNHEQPFRVKIRLIIFVSIQKPPAPLHPLPPPPTPPPPPPPFKGQSVKKDASQECGKGWRLRHRNANRESTAMLRDWMADHKDNPYPSKAERITFTEVAQMAPIQVSTWFANARRRLRKEQNERFTRRERDAVSVSPQKPRQAESMDDSGYGSNPEYCSNSSLAAYPHGGSAVLYNLSNFDPEELNKFGTPNKWRKCSI